MSINTVSNLNFGCDSLHGFGAQKANSLIYKAGHKKSTKQGISFKNSISNFFFFNFKY